MLTGIIAFLIGSLFGIIGMMGMYSIFPDVGIEEPTCICPEIHEDYDGLRQFFSVFGWCFALIPILFWKIKVGRDIDKEEKAQQTFQKVDEK